MLGGREMSGACVRAWRLRRAHGLRSVGVGRVYGVMSTIEGWVERCAAEAIDWICGCIVQCGQDVAEAAWFFFF